GRRIYEACGEEEGGTLSRDLEADRKAIREMEADVLVYPELGMDWYTYYLSFSRLAEVTMVYWGHPVEQGTGGVDYFITSEVYEDVGRDEVGRGDGTGMQRYMMEGLTTVFTEPDVGEVVEWGGEGEVEGKVVYVCSQTLMKFSVGFDEALVGILRRVKDAVVVITFNDRQRVWKNVLEERIRGKLGGGEVGELKFIEALPKGEFYGLLRRADVVLDTFPFGAGVTAMETFAMGGVMVTAPALQTVVRLVKGFYEVMEVEGLVAGGLEEYVDIAVGLGVEAERREELKELVKERSGRLYGDKGAVGEWERMLEGVVGRRRGEVKE
ncbi:hypothetical protein TrRE_jg11374, partial [Triparma retinervis]